MEVFAARVDSEVMRMLYSLFALLIKTMQSRDTADAFGLRTQLKREEAYQQTKRDVAESGRRPSGAAS